MSEGRNIGEVIDRMLLAIPEDDDPAKEHIRQRLLFIKRDTGFLCPEMMPGAWGAIGETLMNAWGEIPPTEGWKGKVVRILTGKE